MTEHDDTLLTETDKRNQDPEVPSVQVTHDLLSLVADSFPAAMPDQGDIESWPRAVRRDVVAWASAVHLRASDNDVDVPTIPFVLA